MRRWIAIAAGIVVLVLVNASIYGRERLLSSGDSVVLELAPVDPRSLMQGDYMALRFEIGNAIRRAADMDNPRDGHVVLRRDAGGVARFHRLDAGEQLAADEFKMRYRVRGGRIKFATNAWFFQEGDAETYASARYGEFRVSADGDSILVGMRDETMQLLLPGEDR